MLMAKVLFASFLSEISYANSILAPLALDYGHQVDITSFTRSITPRKFASELRKYNPTVLCVSFMLYSRDEAVQLARIAKTRGIKTVAGGFHPTLCPDDVLKTGCFDCVVKGDGAGVLVDILNNIDTLNSTLMDGVTSDIFRKTAMK